MYPLHAQRRSPGVPPILCRQPLIVRCRQAGRCLTCGRCRLPTDAARGRGGDTGPVRPRPVRGVSTPTQGPRDPGTRNPGTQGPRDPGTQEPRAACHRVALARGCGSMDGPRSQHSRPVVLAEGCRRSDERGRATARSVRAGWTRHRRAGPRHRHCRTECPATSRRRPTGRGRRAAGHGDLTVRPDQDCRRDASGAQDRRAGRRVAAPMITTKARQEQRRRPPPRPPAAGSACRAGSGRAGAPAIRPRIAVVIVVGGAFCRWSPGVTGGPPAVARPAPPRTGPHCPAATSRSRSPPPTPLGQVRRWPAPGRRPMSHSPSAPHAKDWPRSPRRTPGWASQGRVAHPSELCMAPAWRIPVSPRSFTARTQVLTHEHVAVHAICRHS